MSNTFLCSDLHLSHRGIVKFLREDGVTKERPWDTIEEMNEALISNWNSVVRPHDTVYNLGDVVINRSALPILHRLNGIKVLVKGNHDVFRVSEYLEHFKDIQGSATLDGFICTHIPIHPISLGRWKGNIHGHLHSKRVMTYNNQIDPRYFCVSMEHINYTPLALEDLKVLWEEQQY